MKSANGTLKAHPTGCALGVEIEGIDLREPLDDQTVLFLRNTLAEHQVVIIHDQDISPDQQLRFTQYFGPLEDNIRSRPASHKVPGYEDVLYVSNENDSPTNNYAFGWHSDGLAYKIRPYGPAVLHCLSASRFVGDTLFASQYKAYELLSPTLQAILQDMYWGIEDPAEYIARLRANYKDLKDVPTWPEGRAYVQPVVRAHPKTGRPYVCICPETKQICGMSIQESTAILELLREYQTCEDVLYRHRWSKDDVVLWDNYATLHTRADYADPTAHGLRVLHRTATSGTMEAIECSTDELQFGLSRPGSAKTPALAVGSAPPDLTATTSDGNSIHLAALKGKPVVVYFYPKDETPGCVKEACSFRDAWDKLSRTGVVLIGVSADTDASHKAFAAHHELPFPLVSDPRGSIAASFGVPLRDGRATRQSFIIGADGIVKKIYRTVDVKVHADEIAADLARLGADNEHRGSEEPLRQVTDS